MILVLVSILFSYSYYILFCRLKNMFTFVSQSITTCTRRYLVERLTEETLRYV